MLYLIIFFGNWWEFLYLYVFVGKRNSKYDMKVTIFGRNGVNGRNGPGTFAPSNDWWSGRLRWATSLRIMGSEIRSRQHWGCCLMIIWRCIEKNTLFLCLFKLFSYLCNVKTSKRKPLWDLKIILTDSYYWALL